MGTACSGIPVVDGACAECDGVLWPTGESPKYVKCTVSGITKCGQSPLDMPAGEYWLENINGCSWYLDAKDGWEFFLVLVGVPSFEIWVTFEGNDWSAFSFVDPGCPTSLENENADCEVQFTAGIGGSVTFDWG